MLARTSNDPLSPISQWRRDIERAFDSAGDADGRGDVTAAAWAPAVDIKDEDNAYVLHADLPGVDPKNIRIAYGK